MESKCKGCRTYDYVLELHKGSCLAGVTPHLSETEQCPCITCIIKVMCNKACDDFHDYMTKYKSKMGEKGY